MSTNDRVHSCMDGGAPRYTLTPAEEAELAELEEVADVVSDWVRTAPVPDLSARVMLALPEVHSAPAPSPAARVAAATRRALQWVWAPHAVTLRPAYAFGAALALALVVLGRPDASPGPEAAGTAALAEAPARLFVQFRLDAPEASHVAIAGSFTRWEPRHPMREVSPGVWVAVVPLEPGIHDYQYVVDGEEWVPDPVARPVDDGFGGTNSRLYLASPAQT